MLIGQPTAKAVWANAFFPGLIDLYLGKTGYDSQLIDRPNDQQDDILFHTLPGDPGAHGPYRDRERGPDLEMKVRVHPRALAAAAAALALGVVTLGRKLA
jgi:hypothetical protein